jgi:hypothetical protein
MEEALPAQETVYGKKQLISLNKFIFLNIITFGLYKVWWTYKSWRIFQERDPGEDLMPVWRTLFGIFFYYDLFQRIIGLAQYNGYKKDYSSGYLLVGITFCILVAWLRTPINLLTYLSMVFFFLPFLALNYIIENSEEYEAEYTTGFNTRQIILIVVGSLLWLWIITEYLRYYAHF